MLVTTRTRLLCRALEALLLAAITLPQAAPQTTAQSQAPSQPASIQGTVTGAGSVLKGAEVTLQRAGSSTSRSRQRSFGDSVTATTNSSGQFLFQNVPPGDYRISAEHVGFLRQEYGQRSFSGPGTIITLSAGQSTSIAFQLLSTGSISGRIFNEDREPIAHARVEALAYTYQSGKRTLNPIGEGSETDDRGAYRLYWLVPGDYYVKAVAAGGSVASVNQPGHYTYPPTYFPGQLNPEQASPVSLTPGSEVSGIDFALLPVSTVTVTGQLLLPASFASLAQASPAAAKHSIPPPVEETEPRRGSSVSLQLIPAIAGHTPSDGSNRGKTGPDGAFEIDRVIPGSYYLVARARAGEQQYFARMRLEVGESGINGLTIPLRPGIAIPGNISLDGPPPSAFKLSQIRVDLTASDDFLDAPSGRSAPVADNGSFVLTNVPPLEYRVRLGDLPQGAYLMAARMGAGDALDQPFVAAGDPLQLRISFNAGQVQGSVVDSSGNPVSGVLAALVPDGNRRQRPDLFFSAPTDEMGHVNFSGVAPGSYKLFAWEDIPEGAAQDPDFIRRFDDRGKSVEVDAGRSASVEVSLISRGN